MRPRSLITMPSKVVAANSARRSSLSRTACSSTMRWLTSRTMAVNSRRSRISICEIEISTGNVSPLARRPLTQPGPIILRRVSPVPANRLMCSACRGRSFSGISVSIGWPIASAAASPNISSAAGLNSTMRWLSSTAMMASIADSTRPARSCSLLRDSASAACACRSSSCSASIVDGVCVRASGERASGGFGAASLCSGE
jgi:hypothetical protein